MMVPLSFRSSVHAWDGSRPTYGPSPDGQTRTTGPPARRMRQGHHRHHLGENLTDQRAERLGLLLRSHLPIWGHHVLFR